MKILLIASYFLPDEHIGARRWSRICKYLARLGSKIDVISSAWPDAPLANAQTTAGIRVFRCQPSGCWAARERYRRVGPRVTTPLQSGQKRLQDMQSPLGSLNRFARKVALYLWDLAIFPDASWHVMGNQLRKAQELARIESYDVIVGTHPFCGCLRMCSHLSRQFEVPWIADMRDGWTSFHLSPYKPGTIMYHRLARLERHTLDTSALVLSAGENLTSTIISDQSKTVTLMSGFDPESLRELPPGRPKDAATLELACAGSITHIHDYQPLFDGLKRLYQTHPLSHVSFHYYGAYFQKLASLAQHHGLPKSWFVNHGYCAEQKLLEGLHSHDLLVAFGLTHNTHANYVSGRIFDYLAARRPVLVVAQNESELSKVVATAGVGVLCKNGEETYEVLSKALVGGEAFLSQLLKPNSAQLLSQFSAESAARRFLRLASRIRRPASSSDR